MPPHPEPVAPMPDAPRALFDAVIAFARVLRKNGWSLSAEDVSLAMRALVALSPADIAQRARVKSALAATLVHDAAHRETFSDLFDARFPFRLAPLPPALAVPLWSAAASADGAGMSESARDALMLGVGAPEGAAGAGVMGGQDLFEAFSAALAALDIASFTSPLQVAYFAERLFQQALGEDLAALEAALAQAAEQGTLSAADQETLEQALRARAWHARAYARQALRRVAETEVEGPRNTRVAPTDVRFAQLSALDEATLARTIDTMIESLRTRYAPRRRPQRRGRLDGGATARRALRTSGVPFRLIHHRRKKERPDLVLLCDISDSVRNASVFLLRFVHALSERFRHVRSFVFVSRAGDASALFASTDGADAVTRVLAGEVVPVMQNSDYGEGLTTFLEAVLDGGLTRRTTVLILGDGRGNHRPSESWVLHELCQRARRVWWICPEARGQWGLGDSLMPTYAACVHEVFVAQNIRQLQRVAERLLL